MGRLNYTNRKAEGLKLGQSVAKDLLKRIPPGTGVKSALRDPGLELDVSGKLLQNDGLQEVACTLVKVIRYNGQQGTVLRLEELCLKGNKLDVASLPILSLVVKLAAHDLRDLDLSDNLFEITTSQQAHVWEEFLHSFADTCMLRRLDLSGNKLSPKAFEVLARIYSREPAIDLMRQDDARNDFFCAENPEDLLHSTSKLKITTDPGPRANEDGNKSLADIEKQESPGHVFTSRSPDKPGQTTASDPQRFYAATRGLRSIPYLILFNTSMDETCALHLSYIISNHLTPGRLLKYVPAAKAGPHTQQLDCYDSNSGCRGVVYLPNSDLGIPALKVLELSEALRDIATENTAEVQSLEASPIHSRNVVASRRLAEVHSSTSITAAGNRRASMSKIEQRDSATISSLITELDRARSRIQCNILRDNGVKSNDLWFMALQMLRFCRSLCPHRLLAQSKDTAPSQPVTQKENKNFENSEFPLLPKANPKSFIGYLDPYALPLTPKSPNQITTSVVKAQVLPKVKSPSLFSLAGTSPNTEAVEAKSYRNALPRGLSEEAWWRIIGSCLEADKVMSKAQQRAVLRWGVDRRTIARETESLGKPESLQMWKVLEGMGCLAYDGCV